MPKTSAERQADRRVKLSADGLFKRRDFWVHPDDEEKLRIIEKRLRAKRIKNAGIAV